MTARRPSVFAAMLSALLTAALPLAAQTETPPETQTETPTEAAVVLPAISVAAAQPMVLSDRVIASGLVTAVEEVQVQPLLSGQAIEELLADVGDRVTAGQVLARLSDSTLELQRSEVLASRAATAAAIAQAEAGLIEASASAQEAQRVADRSDTLREQGTISQAAADQADAAAEASAARVRVAEQGVTSARAQLDLVDAQLASLDLQIARTEVTSPVDGIVTARNAMLGAISSGGGQAMFTLIRDGALELRAEIAEEDLLRIAEGQSVSMTTVGAATAVTGTVRLVAPSIDLATRLGEARITIDDSSLVRTGMFLTAEILVSQSEMVAVPVTAIGSGPNGAVVMRVTGGFVEQVDVETGVRDGAMIGVLSGLAPGDLIVTKAAAFVRDGDQINPVETDPSSANED